MSELVDRLRAALDRTEEVARATTCAVPWRVVDLQTDINVADVQGACGGYVTASRDQPCCAVEDATFIAANDPASVLRSVAAHRKILDRHAPRTNILGLHCAYCSGADWQLDWPCDDLLDVASIYFPEAPDA